MVSLPDGEKISKISLFVVNQGYIQGSAGWLHGTAEERWSFSAKLSLSCARPASAG